MYLFYVTFILLLDLYMLYKIVSFMLLIVLLQKIIIYLNLYLIDQILSNTLQSYQIPNQQQLLIYFNHNTIQYLYI
jgi:ABC-type siderophore export system fused ATPase/permease subunit